MKIRIAFLFLGLLAFVVFNAAIVAPGSSMIHNTQLEEIIGGRVPYYYSEEDPKVAYFNENGVESGSAWGCYIWYYFFGYVEGIGFVKYFYC